ncbi:unnamed protein product, partial [Strongylus vulgaris]
MKRRVQKLQLSHMSRQKGYIWNFETQQWDVDPNYDPAQAAAYHAGYDQENYQYDYSGAAPADGYAYSSTYGTTYAYDQNDEYTTASYQQPANGAYDQSAQQYYGQTAGYDQQTGYDQQANYQYDQTASYAGYDQTAGGYPQNASGYNQAAAGYDQTATAYGQAGSGYDQTATPYGQTTAGYDQTASAYGTQQYYDTNATVQVDTPYQNGSYYQAHAGYDQTTEEYSEPHIGLQDYSPSPQPSEYAVTPQIPESAEQQYPTAAYDYSQYSQNYATEYPGYQQGQEVQANDYQTNNYASSNAAAPQSYPTAEHPYPPLPPERPPPAPVFTKPLFQ